MAMKRIWAELSSRCCFTAPAGSGAVRKPISCGPQTSTLIHRNQIRMAPSAAPQLLPDPPTITITQIRKV